MLNAENSRISNHCRWCFSLRRVKYSSQRPNVQAHEFRYDHTPANYELIESWHVTVLDERTFPEKYRNWD